jgi:hypothetical protein
LKSKQNKQNSLMDKTSNPSKQSSMAKSPAAPNNGINFTIQQKQTPAKNTKGLPDNLKTGIEHL